MNRATSSYAIAGLLLLALGIALSRFAGLQQLAIDWRNTVYGFPYQVFCYGFGSFFCVYAFLSSLWVIPFSAALARWHFWLSAGGVLLLVAGFASIVAYLGRHPTDPRVGPALLIAVGSVLGGLLVFSLAQVWFAVDLVRALWRMRGSG